MITCIKAKCTETLLAKVLPSSEGGSAQSSGHASFETSLFLKEVSSQGWGFGALTTRCSADSLFSNKSERQRRQGIVQH